MVLKTCLMLVIAAVLAVAQDTEGEAKIRCNRPMCMMECEMGFKTDNTGCPICECLNDPCAFDERQVCPADTMCTPQDCTSHPCTELAAKCSGAMCAMPMCANHCPDGYAVDMFGCMDCTCKTIASCEEMHCEAGLVCKMYDQKPKCIPKPLCHHMVETMSVLTGQETLKRLLPQCEENGDFRPMQCIDDGVSDEASECWCVDDHGIEIEGSRGLLTEETNCEKMKSRVMHVEVTMIHQFLHIEEHMNGIEQPVKEYLGRWLSVDEELINIVEITPTGDLVQTLYVHITVVSDGVIDLASAAHRMKQLLRSQTSLIPYHEKIMKPQIDTLKFTHEYEPADSSEDGSDEELVDPVKPTDGVEVVSCYGRVRNYYGRHKMTVILSSVGIIVIIVCLIGICTLVAKMKRRSYQFKHKRLENMENFQKNLVLSSDMQAPLDLTGEKKEKPDEVSVIVA